MKQRLLQSMLFYTFFNFVSQYIFFFTLSSHFKMINESVGSISECKLHNHKRGKVKDGRERGREDDERTSCERVYRISDKSLVIKW